MEIKYTSQFKKDLKKYKHNQKVIDRLKELTKLIKGGKELPEYCKLHKLTGNYEGVYDCHVFPDVVLLYSIGETITFIRIGKHNNLSLTESYRLKINENYFFEKLNRLGNDMFITDYVGNIVDLVKNKTDTYRILYDSKIDKYIIASSYDYTHFEMLKKAYDEGYYIDVEDYIDNVSDGLHSYFHDGVYGDSNDKDRAIVCYMVYPDSNTKWLYNDSYDYGYLLNTDDFRFQNGARVVVGIKGNAFADEQFFKAFGKPRILSKKELAESAVNSEYLSEDTCCIPSKTSYSEDGFDKNGIYYFGKKPKLPVNWKDYKKSNNKRKKSVSEMVIKERYDDSQRYRYEASKSVTDSDGFTTEYTMYYDTELDRYVFVFGDSDLYDPNDGYEEFDWECDSPDEADAWFADYIGFGDDDENDYYESVNRKSVNESVVDEYGMFEQLDDVMSGMVDNVDDDEIDDAVRHFENVARKLGAKTNLGKVQCFFCNADWLNPKDNSFDLQPMYKSKKYNAYIGEYNGKKFIVDKFSNNFDFTVYALDEKTISDMIEEIEENY